jgi:hypothetical protein
MRSWIVVRGTAAGLLALWTALCLYRFALGGGEQVFRHLCVQMCP